MIIKVDNDYRIKKVQEQIAEEKYKTYQRTCSKCSPAEKMKHCFSCQACEKDTKFAWIIPDADKWIVYGMCSHQWCQENYARIRHHTQFGG